MLRFSSLLSCLQVMLVSQTAIASGLDEEDLLVDFRDADIENLQTVLSVNRVPRTPEDLPAAVTVISKAMIESSTARTIPELFRMVPGFIVGYYDGNDPVVTYHGLSDQFSRRLQILVDGRSVYVPSFGGVPWDDIALNLEDIERIEIIRGPNTAAYGANAFLAIINIQTQHASETFGDQVKTRFGSNGVVDTILRHSNSSGDLDYRFSLNHQQDEGLDSDQEDSKRINSINTRLDYYLTDEDLLFLSSGWSGQVHEIGDESQIGVGTDIPRQAGKSYNFQHIKWEHNASTEEQFYVQFSHNYHNAKDAYHSGPFPIGSTPTLGNEFNYDIAARRYDLELQHTGKGNDNFSYIAGLNSRQDEVISKTYFNTEDTQYLRMDRAFGNIEYRDDSNTWLLNLGAMHEKNSIDGSHFSPRFAINLHASPKNTLRLVHSEATRSPVLFEEYSDWIESVSLAEDVAAAVELDTTINQQIYLSSGGLQSEKIRSLEFGWLHLAEYLENDKNILSVDLKLFHDEITGFISANRQDPEDFINQDKYSITGAEIQLSMNNWHSWHLLTGLTLQSVDVSELRATEEQKAEQNEENPVYYSEEIEDSVPHTIFSLSASYKLASGINLSGLFQYYDKLNWIGYRSDEDTIHDMSILDLKLSKHFRLNDEQRLKLAITFKNILDKQQEFREDNYLERNAYFDVQYDF